MTGREAEKDAYGRVLEAFRHTEAFDDMLTPEDTAELLLNLVHHFVPANAAGVWSADGRVLARRALSDAEESSIGRHVTEAWIDYFRREFRPVMMPRENAEGGTSGVYVAAPLYFGWTLIGYGVLQLDEEDSLSEWRLRVVEILARAAGTALGRLTQAAEIESEKAHARNLFSSIVSPLLVVDPRGAIVAANAAAQGAFGRDVVGRHYHDLFGFVSNDPIAACLESGEAQHRIEVFGKGERLWGVTASPHTLDDRTTGAVIGFRDLTDLKRMEEALAATERQAIIGRLAATVAHEVNNPLGAIKAHLKLLQKRHADDDEAAAGLEVISGQVDRIARTVRLLLGFSRQRSAPDRTVSPAEILRTVAALFEEGFREKEIGLATECPDDLPHLRADADQIQEVMVNLLENCRDALGKGSRVRVGARVEGAAVEIVVEDDGPGLGEEPERIFEPFYTTKTTGTGLGLTIARKICESHGGRLMAENRTKEEGGGARFRAVLPARAP